MKQIKPLKLKGELHIRYKFYMPDNRKTDLSNKIESINDLFVRYWIIEDDNRKIIRNIEAESMWIDRNNPRCEIQIFIH